MVMIVSHQSDAYFCHFIPLWMGMSAWKLLHRHNISKINPKTGILKPNLSEFLFFEGFFIRKMAFKTVLAWQIIKFLLI